jgi:hypothetical protein
MILEITVDECFINAYPKSGAKNATTFIISPLFNLTMNGSFTAAGESDIEQTSAVKCIKRMSAISWAQNVT